MEKTKMLRAKRQKYVIIEVSFEFKLDSVYLKVILELIQF